MQATPFTKLLPDLPGGLNLAKQWHPVATCGHPRLPRACHLVTSAPVPSARSLCSGSARISFCCMPACRRPLQLPLTLCIYEMPYFTATVPPNCQHRPRCHLQLYEFAVARRGKTPTALAAYARFLFSSSAGRAEDSARAEEVMREATAVDKLRQGQASGLGSDAWTA